MRFHEFFFLTFLFRAIKNITKMKGLFNVNNFFVSKRKGKISLTNFFSFVRILLVTIIYMDTTNYRNHPIRVRLISKIRVVRSCFCCCCYFDVARCQMSHRISNARFSLQSYPALCTSYGERRTSCGSCLPLQYQQQPKLRVAFKSARGGGERAAQQHRQLPLTSQK